MITTGILRFVRQLDIYGLPKSSHRSFCLIKVSKHDSRNFLEAISRTLHPGNSLALPGNARLGGRFFVL
jgi:hypothetical protein